MILQVKVCSRTQIKAMEGDKDTALISFSTPHGDKFRHAYPEYNTPSLKGGWAAILAIRCSDCLPEDVKADPRVIPFTESQALQIVEFVEGNREKQFIIHCDAGVSRSVACGMFVSEWLKRPLNLLAFHGTKFANVHIRLTLERAWEKRFQMPSRESVWAE